MLLFCVGAMAFPFGFIVDDINGKFYQLPDSYKLGYSYYTYFASIVLLFSGVAIINSDMIRLNFGAWFLLDGCMVSSIFIVNFYYYYCKYSLTTDPPIYEINDTTFLFKRDSEGKEALER